MYHFLLGAMEHSIFYLHLPYGRHFFVLSSMALVGIFRILPGSGRGEFGKAILLIDPRNHFFQSESSLYSKTRVLESSFYIFGNSGSVIAVTPWH